MTGATVHVIDDDDAVRESLGFLLETAGYRVATYDSAISFLADPPQGERGCIVTDVRMPGLSGLELTARLKALGFALPVIVITGHADVPLAVQAMKSGACDFIEKPFDDEAILSAIRTALDQADGAAEMHGPSGEILQRIATLSMREQQVLHGLVDGKPNKVLARDLGISPRTVEVYRANVMTKMQAGSLSELVRMALLAERA